jgi:hypothetical protein
VLRSDYFGPFSLALYGYDLRSTRGQVGGGQGHSLGAQGKRPRRGDSPQDPPNGPYSPPVPSKDPKVSQGPCDRPGAVRGAPGPKVGDQAQGP